MGKNKVGAKNPGKSGNPIYKKAGQGAPHKAKGKVKPVKINLKKLKLANREAVAALDQQMDKFRAGVQNNAKTTPLQSKPPNRPPPQTDQTQDDIDQTMDAMAQL